MLAPTVEAPKTALRYAERAEFGILMPMLTESASLAADITCWADTLDQLLADAPARQRLGEAARLRSNDFTHKRIFGQWKELIDGLLNRNARA